MSRSSFVRSLCAGLVAAMLASGASQTFAAAYSWTPKSGAGNWTTTASWDLNNGTYPNAIGDVVKTDGNLTANMTITLGAPITLSSLAFGDRNNSYFSTTFSPGVGGSFTFSSTTGTAAMSQAGSVNQTSANENVLNTPLNLDSTLNVSFSTTSGVANISVTGSVTASSAGLKMIRYVPGSGATTTGASYLNFSGNITDGSGQVGIRQNCLAPSSANSLKLTGTGNNFSGPVEILSRILEASPASGTNGVLGTGSLQLGNTTGLETATLNLGGSLSTVTEQNAITVPEGSSGARRIAVTGTGNRILSGGMSVLNAGGVTLACPSAGSMTFSNAITGTGPVTISSTGAGVVIFGGNNTYTGATTVTQGSLRLDGSLDAASTLSVAAAARLGGSGTANGTATISGTMSPGASGATGVLSLGSLVLTSTSTSLIELSAAGTRGTDYDGLSILNASGLTYGGTMSLAFGGSKLASTTFDVFSFTGSSAGSFATVASTGYYAGTWTNNNDGTYSFAQAEQTLTFTQSTGDVIVVPEPAATSVAALGIAAAIACLRLKRSRHRHPGG